MSSTIAPARRTFTMSGPCSHPKMNSRSLSVIWKYALSSAALLLLLTAIAASSAMASGPAGTQPHEQAPDPLFRFAVQQQFGYSSESGDVSQPGGVSASGDNLQSGDSLQSGDNLQSGDSFRPGDEFRPGDAVAIQPDLEFLASSLYEGRELLLPSLPGDDDRYRITAVREFVDGVISVTAVHAESPYDQLSFSFNQSNGSMLGSVHRHTRGQTFHILPPELSYQKTASEAAGYHRFMYADPDEEDYVPCGVDHELYGSEAMQSHHHDPLSQSHVHSAFDIQSSGLEGSVPIDVMIVYTLKAAQWASNNGGGISTVIGQMMNISQAALDNSHANIDLRIVHTYFTLYEETGVSRTDLFRLATSADFSPWGSEYEGYMEEVHTLRDQHGADLVSMLTTNSDAGGLAFMLTNPAGNPQLGFSLNRVQQMATSTTFVHEIGHNLGKAHSRNQRSEAAGAFGGMFDYSTGWRFTGDSGTSYATVMAYAEALDQSNSSRIEYFSNPEVMFDGVPTGTYSGQFAPADNVRSMQYSRNLVASYRPTEVDPPLASMDNSLIEVEAGDGEMRPVRVTLSNDGDSPLFWTADVRFPDPPGPAKIAFSETTGMAFEAPDRPVVASSPYPFFDAHGDRLIRYADRAEYSAAPAAAAFSAVFTNNADPYSISSGSDGGSFVTDENSSGVRGNLVYQTDFDFIPGSQQPVVAFQTLNEWSAWPRDDDAAFFLSNEDPNSEPRNLRLTPISELESGRWTGASAPFFGPLTSQGYSISMDLKVPSLSSDNRFHILVEEPSKDKLTAWLWFDDGRIIIRNQITPEGFDFFDSGVAYTPNEYFHFEIRTDPLNGRIYYLIDGNQFFDGNLFEGSAPERILFAHLNHQTTDVFEIDNFHISTLSEPDFPRFQFRKESGGIASGSSAEITFDVMTDFAAIGVYEFDLEITTNDAANPVITVPVRYTVTDDPVSADQEQLAGEFRLNQNYPNPFNPSTYITYALPEQADVRLEVFTINGQRVAVLVDETRQAGEHQVAFDASGLASGVYLYRLQAGPFTKTQRMVLVK